MYDASFLKTFIDEGMDHLSAVENDLLAMERGEGRVDQELVNRVFRAAHSIKGGAGFFDLANIRELAHKLENILDMLRSGAMSPDPEVVNMMLKGFDRLRELLLDTGSSDTKDISDEVVALDGLATSHLPDKRKTEVVEIRSFPVPNSVCVLTAGSLQLRSARESGRGIALVRCDLIHDVQRMGKTPLQIIRELDENGIVFDSAIDSMAVGDLDSEEISPLLPFYILYGSSLPMVHIARLLDIPLGGVTMLELPKPAVVAPPVAAPPVAAPPVAVAVAVAAACIAKAPPSQRATDAPEAKTSELRREGVDSSVRVSLRVLETLVDIAGELVLARNELAEAIGAEDFPLIKRSGRRIDSVTREIQEAVMLTRMQPIGSLFDHFPRVVRDMARSTGKKLDLVLDGHEVEVDRTIIELLSDPMTHIIRNACDHGIEAPADRSASGKPETGTITLKARYEGGAVLVEVRDDGKGIDYEAVAAKAVKLGHVSAERVARMSAKEKTALIMLPGLSTARVVTDLSGRGVGMDVVKTNINKLGGQIETLSERGKGTVFRIRLPLTLAIMPSLLVEVGEERFAIPQTNIEEMLTMRVGDAKTRIERVGDSAVLVLRGQFLPIVRLAQVLGMQGSFVDPESGERESDNRRTLEDRRGSSSPAPTAAVLAARRGSDRRFRAASDLKVVVVNSTGLRYAIVVDSIQETMEIVVKPLGRHFSRQTEYSGATILGNGDTALILDTSGLADRAGLSAASEGVEDAKAGEAEAEAAREFLAFGNGANERGALPLLCVDRVRPISREELSIVGGIRIWTGEGRTETVFTLADCLGLADVLDGMADLALVSMTAQGRSVGLLVSLPVDFSSASGKVDQSVFEGRGLAGSMVIDGHTTLIIDPDSLFRAARPEWYAEDLAPSMGMAAAPKKGASGALVLLAEDSGFFRAKISALLESSGYRVLGAEDGSRALDLFQDNPGIVAVVSDLEMPVMGGADLARRLRSKGTRIPIIALTSLASEEDKRLALEAGVTEFMIKLDEEELVSCLARLIRSGQSLS